MEHVPIPEGTESDRRAIRQLAERCCALGLQRYYFQQNVQERITKSFGRNDKDEALGNLNTKAQEWWMQPFHELGAALKTSFKLARNPFANPKTADEWEPYLADKRRDVEALSHQLRQAEAEINDRVYRLFDLTPDEVELLKREVEH
jgi:hypothetical protein